MGTWLQGEHWHPWGAACSAPPPWGDTRGDCHPQDPKWPWPALTVQWGQLQVPGGCSVPWGLLGGCYIPPCAPAVCKSDPHIPRGRRSPSCCFPVPWLVVAGDSPAPTHLPPCISFQNQLILGVMGIDVALNDIKRLTPRYNVRGDPFPLSLPCTA